MNLSFVWCIHYELVISDTEAVNTFTNMVWDLSNTGQKANDDIHGKYQMPRDIGGREIVGM